MNNKDTSLIFAYSGYLIIIIKFKLYSIINLYLTKIFLRLDGFIRFVDYPTSTALLSIKSFYGGINTITFSESS
jgi:hypothetical protein